MADIMRRPSREMSRRWGWPFDRMFEDLFEALEPSGRDGEEWRGQFVPAIDVTENEDEVTLTAEVPGMSKEDMEVSVDNGVLSLRGEKKEEQERDGESYHRVERRYGRFERRIRLPQYVDANKIAAEYQDGILKLHMPKQEAAKAKSIEIK